jgi:hypothetical protein
MQTRNQERRRGGPGDEEEVDLDGEEADPKPINTAAGPKEAEEEDHRLPESSKQRQTRSATKAADAHRRLAAHCTAPPVSHGIWWRSEGDEGGELGEGNGD